MKDVAIFRQTELTAREFIPNRWVLIAFPLVFGLLALAGIGAHQTLAPITVLNQTAISLDPANLPGYALRTTLRMLAALVASLVFTFLYGTLAAKSRRAELVLIPLLDILQSVPVLGYISFTIVFFMSLFPGRVAGAEAAAVFAIFTSQAWNMTFSFYQSLRTVPRDLEEATNSFHFSSWLRFWRLEVPFAMPGLVWNMMMSMSGGWFFVVASEAITVGDKTIVLPGIGSYLAEAIAQENMAAIGWVILAMTIVIMLYDQLMFRPLVAWADKFRFEQTGAQTTPESWFLQLLHRTRMIRAIGAPTGRLFHTLLRMKLPVRAPKPIDPDERRPASRALDLLWYALVFALAAYAVWRVISFVGTEVHWSDVATVFTLGLYTLTRVVVLIVIASLIWVPLGVMIGLRPAARRENPAAGPVPGRVPCQFAVSRLRRDDRVLPCQSRHLVESAHHPRHTMVHSVQRHRGHDGLSKRFPGGSRQFPYPGLVQWWRQVMLPGIFPYFVTGAVTAAGGAWNASIVAEVVKWGHVTLTAHGLGAYIAQMTASGDYPRIVLGIAVMSLFVTLFNRLLWRPLYRYAENRLRLD